MKSVIFAGIACPCGRAAEIYAMDTCPGGWADYYCRSCKPLVEYEVVVRVRVQGDSMDDIGGLVIDALGEHDEWPVEVYEPETGEQLAVLVFDKNTGKVTVGPE